MKRKVKAPVDPRTYWCDEDWAADVKSASECMAVGEIADAMTTADELHARVCDGVTHLVTRIDTLLSERADAYAERNDMESERDGALERIAYLETLLSRAGIDPDSTWNQGAAESLTLPLQVLS